MSYLLRSLRLMIPTYLGVIAFSYGFWVALFIAIITPIRSEAIAFSALSLGILLTGFLWFVVLGLIYRLLLKILWSNPPKWVIPMSGIKNTVVGYVISLFATIPVVLTTIPNFLREINARISGIDPSIYREYLTVEAMIDRWWIWLLSAICLSYLLRKIK